MQPDYTISQGDLLPGIPATFTYSDGTAVDLSAATALNILIGPLSSSLSSLTSESARLVTDGKDGKLVHDLLNVDTMAPGFYKVKFQASIGGKVLSLPTSGFFVLEITESARPTMYEIVYRVRGLINDPTSSPTFSDIEIQKQADRHRIDQRYLELTMPVSILTGGIVKVLDYYAPMGDWEADEVIQDNTWATVTPNVIDRAVGKWSFTTEPKFPLWITGKTYDLYATAADLLEEWAGKLHELFDFTNGGQRFEHTKKIQNKLDMAENYRRKAKPKNVHIGRSDINC